MAEAVGGAILTAVIQVLVESLASPGVTNFFQNNHSVSKLLEKLKITLGSANSLLNDAEDKGLKDVNVKNWVDNLNEVLNEADNAMDDIHTEALWCKIEGKALLKKIIPTSFDPFEGAIKQKLEEIIERIELLLGQRDHLGLKAGVKKTRVKRSPAPLIGDPSFFYGRESNKEAIIQLLFLENSHGQDKISENSGGREKITEISENSGGQDKITEILENSGRQEKITEISENSGGQEKIMVIPIVGMGGLGKTTLARLVYNDSRVKDRFAHKAWVTVSDNFDVFKIAKLVLEGLSGKECKVAELEKLGEELEKFLRGKKFFLVLDDVWNENYTLWNSLKSYFQVGADGSKIIMTTRSEQIGSKMGSVSSHSLTPMGDDDCWKLFQKHAFRSVEECTKQLETIGKEIVRKCKGLPIAVVSLAGLLRSVSDPKEWEKVQNNDIWEIEREGDYEILPSLWFSYSYLPSNVKRCFAYCSIFPKDYEYEKEKIMLLWMAEGLVQGEKMEDVGEEYFKTLVSRSLLQRSAKDESSFVMHDLVHDLATFVSGKGFCLRLGKGDGLERLSNKTRHLLCYSYLDDPKGLSRANNLRTFISNSDTSDRVSQEFPKKLGCLRVLCLSFFLSKKVPDSIGKLKHLRYLDLSRTLIKELPGTVCSLYNLQTLLLRKCLYLTHLPAKMEKLINLRHLDISHTWSLKEIPQGVYKLKKLIDDPSFSNATEVSLEDCNHCSQLPPFGQLPSLKKLCVTSLDSVKMIGSEFYGSSGATPFPCLKILEIEYMSNLQSWSFEVEGAFPCLEELTIKFCPMLKTISLDPIHCLPSLKKLSIWYCPTLEFSGLPSSLKELTIWNCDMFFAQRMQWGLKALTDLRICYCKNALDSFPEEGLLPTTLVSLRIIDIPNLKSLNGKAFQHLTSLKTLMISRCPQLQSLPEEGLPASLQELRVSRPCRILEARLKRETGKDWHKISHIPTIYFN